MKKTFLKKFFLLQRFQTFDNAIPKKTITGTSSKDSIKNTGPFVKIFGNGGNDTIDNQASVVTINGGAGNDSIYCNESDKVKIFGGAGDDSVNVYNYNLSGITTITAGAGDDYISLGGGDQRSVIKYTYGDGDDTIIGLYPDDTLRIATPKKFTTVSSGSGLYFVFDTGSICLYNYYNIKVVTVKGGNSSNTTSTKGSFDNYKTNRIITGTSNSDSIENTGSLVKIYGNGGNDYIRNDGELVTIYGGAGNDTILNYLEHHDYDNYDYQYNAENVTISGGKGNDLIDPGDDGNNVIQYTYGDGNDTIMRWGSNDTLQIITPKKFTTVTGGSDLYFYFDNGNIITLKDCYSANVVTIKGSGSSDDGDGGDTLPAGISVKNGIVTATKKFTGSKIDLADYSGATKVNAAAVTKNISIIGSAKNNSLRGGSGADTISGGKGNDTLTGGAGKDIFVYSGGNDVITDYVAGTDRINISGSYEGAVSGSNVILKTSGGTLKILNGANKNLTVNGTTKIYSPSTTLNLTNSSKSSVTLSSDYIDANASKRTKAVEIVGNAKNNSLVGGKKADTLNGGAGSDILTGGKGADKFLHSAGNDVITDYTAEDTIFLIDTDIVGTKYYVDDLIWTTDNGSLTVKNGLNKKITYYDSERNPHVIDYKNISYSNNFTVLTVTKNFAGDKIDLADYAETVKKVNASKVTENIEIVGNNKNNILIGGSGANILIGGEGNDTLTGNGGKDIFVHSTGDDVITDYKASEDKIQLDNTEIVSYKVSDDDFIFTTSTGTLKILNGTGKNITVIDSDGEEKIYSKNSSANLAEITENNFVGEFENYEEKVTAENLITFAK